MRFPGRRRVEPDSSVAGLGPALRIGRNGGTVVISVHVPLDRDAAEVLDSTLGQVSREVDAHRIELDARRAPHCSCDALGVIASWVQRGMRLRVDELGRFDERSAATLPLAIEGIS